MGKRKVSTTTHHRTLMGSRSTTYVHDGSPGRVARFAAFTGIAPWQPRRFVIAVWVFVWLSVMNRSALGGWLMLAISAVLVGGWVLFQRRREARRAAIAARPAAPVPGPAWCDHCADWTVHPTDQHAAV
jgi:hypothetical protein